MDRVIPLYTLEGVKDADISTHYITTEDKLGLSMLRFNREPCEDIVLIMHGLTTSTDMFIMPEHYNLVSYLLDNEFSDVWTFDYRMSNRHSYNMYRNRYNMDDIALFDIPPAIDKIRKVAGNCRIHVIAHCLGGYFICDEFVWKSREWDNQCYSEQYSVDASHSGLVEYQTTHRAFFERIHFRASISVSKLE